MQTIRPVALGAAVVLALGVAGAAPAFAAPKPRLPISITGQPSNPSDSSAAGFTWSTVAGATYTCQLDNAAATSCTSPKSYSGLADGTHKFVVQGKKNGSYRPGSASVTWTVDSVPPGAPTIAPVATPTATTSASISFTNSDVTAVSHRCALDGAVAVTCTSPWSVPGPLAEGSHTVTVQSRGLSGTLGGSSSVTWVVDLTAPASVLLTGPTSPTRSTSASFTFSSVGATSFGCALDGAAAVPCTSPYVVNPVSEGSHAMVVSASDAAGNPAQPGTSVWTVDTTAPPAPSILTGPATVTNQTGVDFVVANPDGSAVLQCRVDSTSPGGWTTCPSPLHLVVAGQTLHTLEVRSMDTAGNASNTAGPFSWTLDLTVPQPAQFLSGPSSPTSSTTAEFDFVPSDPTDTGFDGFRCSFDGGAFVSCDVDSVPLGSGPLSEGQHVLQVKTVDTALNQSAAASRTWIVDATAPREVVLDGPASLTQSASASFTFSSAGATSFGCALDGAAAVPCASPYVLSSVAEGSHTLVVTASDAAGNAAQPGTTSWTVDERDGSGRAVDHGAVRRRRPTRPVSTWWLGKLDSSTTLQCRLDSSAPGDWAACPSPLHLTVAGEGSHTLEVRSLDDAGNASTKDDVHLDGRHDGSGRTVHPERPSHGDQPDRCRLRGRQPGRLGHPAVPARLQRPRRLDHLPVRRCT